jgi:hypothetical protein
VSPSEPSHREHRSERALLPGVETLLWFSTFPEAICTLRHDSVEDDILRLYADDRGIVQFHVRAARGADPVEMILETSAPNGDRETHRIVLSADASAAATRIAESIPAPGEDQPSIPPLAQDLMTAGNSELIARGYPPRPDPTTAPVLYAQWLRIVSRPWTVSSKRLVSRPDGRFGQRSSVFSPTLPLPPPRTPMARSVFNTNANSWSGAQYTQPVAQYHYINGTWRVPSVALGWPGQPQYSAASMWVGLTANKLFQSGSQSEAYNYQISGFPQWNFTNYWMWIEAANDPPWVIPNFPISPGDEVQVIIFVADAEGTTWFADGYWGGLTNADDTVWFMVYNNTRGLVLWATLPSDGFFTGTSAEFILERWGPLNGGSPYPLAPFFLAEMWDGWYGDSQVGYQQLFPLGSGLYDSGPTYLNMVSNSTNDTLDFVVPYPDQTNGGEALAFYWVWYQ